jgi:hypothetical protein
MSRAPASLAAALSSFNAYYVNEALKTTQGGNPENATAALVEGFALYQSIQPRVAKALRRTA